MTFTSAMRRPLGRYRFLPALPAFLASAPCAHAAARGISDSEMFCLQYAFVVVPIYVVLMLVALGMQFLVKSERGRSATRSVRCSANLLPIAMALAFLVFKYIARPSLPGHYSTIGFYVTWGCILAPLPLVLAANYVFLRLPKLHQLASSPWWIGLHAATTAAVIWMLL